MISGDAVLAVKPLFEQYLEKEGYLLVDLRRYKNQRGENLFEVLADRREGGITLDECARLSAGLGRLLDEQGIFAAPYTLDVSSPGVDRPLLTVSDFRRVAGRQVRFFLNEPVEGKIEHCGTVESVEEQAVNINVKDRTLRIPLERVHKAKQVIS